MSVLKVWDGSQYVPIGGSGGSSGSSNSAGLAGTGAYYVLASGNSTLPNSQVLTSGSSTTVRTDGTGRIYVDATTGGGSGTLTKDLFYYMQAGRLPVTAASSGNRFYLGGAFSLSLNTTVVNIVNSAACLPFIVTKNISADSMACRVDSPAGTAGTTIQLGIYTNSADSVIYPFSAVVTSGILTGSNAGLTVAFNPSVVLSANNLYWLLISIKVGTPTMQTYAVANFYSVFGASSVLDRTSHSVNIVNSGSLPPTMATNGTLIATVSPPVLGIRAS